MPSLAIRLPNYPVHYWEPTYCLRDVPPISCFVLP